MPTPTIVGTTKGSSFGVPQTIVGIVFESADYDNKIESTPFPDQNGNTTAVAYYNPYIDISLKGMLVNGTTFTGTLGTVLSLSAIPNYLGVTGGSTILEQVKISDASAKWRSIDLAAKYMPGVS